MIPLDCSWNFTIHAQVVHLVLWNGNVTCCKATFVIPVITSTTIVYIIVFLLVPIYCIRCCPFNPWSETVSVQLNMIYLCFAKIRCISCNYSTVSSNSKCSYTTAKDCHLNLHEPFLDLCLDTCMHTAAKFQQLLLQYYHHCNTVHLNAMFLSKNTLIELLFLHDYSIWNGQLRHMLKLHAQKTSDMKRVQNYKLVICTKTFYWFMV